MKLKHLIDPVAVDMDTLLRVMAPDLDRGRLTSRDMYFLLDRVSIQRAYDDSHPGFKNGTWTRILPFDGRDYCFYYEGGANDSHVSTLLRHVKTKLIGMENENGTPASTTEQGKASARPDPEQLRRQVQLD